MGTCFSPLPLLFLLVIPRTGNLLGKGVIARPLHRSYRHSVRREYPFWVYILASRSRDLYTGMTNNLPARLQNTATV